MRLRFKSFILFVAATLLLILPASYVLTEGLHKADDEQSVRILTKYLRAVYSRDFKHAYRFVSAEDKRLRERGSTFESEAHFPVLLWKRPESCPSLSNSPRHKSK